MTIWKKPESSDWLIYLISIIALGLFFIGLFYILK